MAPGVSAGWIIELTEGGVDATAERQFPGNDVERVKGFEADMGSVAGQVHFETFSMSSDGI